MECGLCGTLNRDLARFCGGCGAPLGRVCVNCKSEIDAGLRFCDQCGTPVEAAEAPVAPASPQGRAVEAVRKTVTVLFADLGGSTGFGERTDPEVARQVLARYHALLQEAIDAHRGTVAKFMGDGMMATFGIPEVAEDDAERAVRAGIEIQERFARFADDVESTFGERLTARVGVNTGEVVIGAADADLVGDALNVAARLEKACRPGHVLVGDETWRLTRGVLAYESLGEVTVAGRAQPVGTYEVATSERAAEKVAPFVGRDTELARLVTAFDHARSERAAVLVTVIGSPGLGKTRLSRELAAYVSAEGDAATFEIRCDRSGGSTFAPVADLLREAAGLEVSEADDTVTHEKLGALIRDDGDRARVVDALAGVLGAAPARSVEETFWAVRRTMESIAADHPLLVVIDDIQWAEPKLLDLIDHLAEWVTGVPLLLVGLARPELRDLRPAFVEPGRRVSHVVALDGLDVRATEALAAGLLGSALPRELVARLPASTDGNPLFVRELVRMLVDDGVIRRRDDGTWDLAIDADAVEVPPTIQSLLSTRVERLPADELRMLELASVVGAEFSVGALHALGGDDLALPTLLERLRRKELVEPTGTYWGDEPLHRFHHVLIRDAAYRRLLKGARADLHRRVGEWTDATARNVVGEHETTIAFHFEQAHRYRSELGVLDDETDRLGRRAAELLDVAARRAFDRDDLASAGALAGRALAVLPDADAETRAELLLMACECLLASGDVGAGAPLVDDLTAVGTDDPKLAAWASCFHAQLVALTDPDRLVEAEGIATDAAETLQGLGDGAGEAKAHQVRALLLARLGRVGEAEAVLDLALGAARAADDRRRVTAVLGAAPQAALFGPSPVARAGGRCLDVVRLLRITTASPSVEATSMRCQAVLEALRGRFDVSRSMLASSRASLEELGLRHGLLETDLYAGIVELIAGDPAAAVAPLRAAYQGLGTLGVGADAGQAAALLATALLAQGETDEAELMAAESEALAGQNLKTAIAWRIAKASVLAARDAVAEGVALAQEAVEIASATDLVLDHADACVVLADLRDTSGDAAGARAARDEARRLYEAKGATVPAERLASPARQVTPPSRVPPSPAPAVGPHDTPSPACENTTTRLVGRLTGYIGTDLAPPADLVSASFALDDRRALVGLPRGGGEEIWANFSMMRDQGYRIEAPVPIAVRGERLALHRTTAVTPSGDETALLSIDELDDDLRIGSVTWFDDDDLLAAMEELDDRYVAGEGAVHGEVVGLARAAARWLPDGGSAAPRSEVSPAFRFVDHRRIGFEPGGFDQYRTVSGLGTDLADVRFVHRKLFVSGRAVLSLSEASGAGSDGTQVQWVVAAVVHFDEQGLLDALEWFDEDDFDAALARLDELAAASTDDRPAARVDNATTRAMQRVIDLCHERRFDEMRRLLADDFLREDRRQGVSAPAAVGPEEFIRAYAAWFDVGFETLAMAPLAVRGERLGLARLEWRSADGRSVGFLAVYELDADGRVLRGVHFDETDVAAAVDDLDARYVAAEGAADAEVLTRYRRFTHAYDARDWATLRALLTDDFVSTDHRTVGFGTVGPDEFVALCRVGLEMMPDYVQLCRTIHVVGRAGLGTVDGWGTLEDGGRYEWTIHYLMQGGADGRVQRIEWFDEDDLDAATTRLQELGTAPLVGPVLANAATAATARTLELLDQARWDEVRALYSAEFVRIDRRAVIGDGVVPGVRAQLENLQAIYASNLEVDWHALAVRGDRLALTRFDWVVEGFDLPMLQLVGLDADGRCDLLAVFDVDDLDAAIDELDARYLAGEGAEHAELLELCARFVDLAHRNDREGLLEILAPDLTVVDHLPIGFGAGDLEHFLATLATQPQVASIGTSIIRAVEIRGSVVLAVSEMHQITAEGNDYTEALCTLVDVGPGNLIRRLEWFPDEQYGAAVARLHELGVVEERRPVLDNAATRTSDVFLARLRDGDLAGMFELMTEGLVHDDTRAVVGGGHVVGRATVIDNLAVINEMGLGSIEHTWVATRGDRLALGTMRFLGTAEFEVMVHQVFSVDERGLHDYFGTYDGGDLTGALADLDARYLAGEGAGSLPVLAAGVAWVEASRNRDVDALRAVIAPDLVCVDHQPLGFGTLDRDGIIAATQLRFEVSSDDVVIVRSVQCDGPVLLARHYAETTTAENSRYEREAIYVLRVDADGRIDRWDVYGDDQSDAALARFHELAAVRGAPPIENTASQVVALICEVASRGGLSEVSDWQGVAPDVVRVDRRRVVTAPPIHDRQGFAENAAAFFEVFDTVDPEVVAVRGDRLALIRLHCGRAPDFVLRILCLYEFDADGQLAFEADYDDDDLRDALTELDDRYVAGEGAPNDRILRVCAEFEDVNNRRDFDATQRMLAPDFVMEDRTRLGFGVGDREYFDASNRSREEVAVDGSAVVRKVEIDGDVLLAVVEGHRYTPEGNDYAWASCIVLQIDAADLIRRAVYFDDDRYPEAVARLHELARVEPQRSGSDPENAATRVEHETTERIARRETHLGDLVAPDFRHDDRRSIVNLGHLDRAAQVRNLELMREQGYIVGPPEPLAIRGERLCLSRRVARTPTGDESPVLSVNELDEAGRWSSMTFFDHDALDAALDDLDERYASGEGTEHAYVVRRTSDLRRAVTAHDWEAIEALVGDDFTFSDHRSIGLPDADREGYVAAMIASAEQTPDVRLMTRTLETDGDVTLARTRRVGATAEGFEYDWEQLAVSRWAAGLLRSVDLFALDDAASARARFAELAAQTMTPYVDNAQVRFVMREQWRRQYAGGDPLSVTAEDCVLVDRRASVNAGVITGGVDVSASIQSGIDVFGRLELVPLATRGDRVGLYRWAFVQDGGFATPALTVLTSAEDLRVTRIESFDESDLAAAVDVLEERHAQLRGEALTWVERALADAERTLNHRDLGAFASLLAPEFTIADHRRLGMAMDRDAYLDNLGVLIEQAPDFSFFFEQPHVDGDVTLTVAPLVGTTPEGNRYEWSFVQVMVGDPHTGRALAFEFFDDEQWDDAVARFEELVAAASRAQPRRQDPDAVPEGSGPDNAAARTMLRWYALRGSGDPTADALTTDDIAMVDRRRGVSLPMIQGRDAFNEAMDATAAVFREIETRPLAVRGERLALIDVLRSNDGFELSTLVLVEAASDGRIHRVVIFGESDVVAALEVLDRRHLALAADLLPVERNQLATYGALNRRDWPAFTAGLDDDLVIVDHRRIGFPPGRGSGALTGELQGLVVQVPDVVACVTAVRAQGRAALVTTHQHGTATVGGHATWDFHTVVTGDADGRVVSLEYFDADRWDEARARFDTLARREAGDAAEASLELARTVTEAFAARDWDAIRALTGDDVHLVDRRSTVSSHDAVGADAVITLLRGFADVGFVSMENEVLATRGVGLSLLRRTFRTASGFELQMLAVAQLGADVRRAALVLFDVDDLDAATAELDRRDHAGGA